MAAPRPKKATYQDVLEAPPHMVAEVIHGELRLMTRPSGPHTAVASALGDLLVPFKRGRGGPGGWIILDEPELHLGEHIVVPDLAGWRVERMPRATNDGVESIRGALTCGDRRDAQARGRPALQASTCEP